MSDNKKPDCGHSDSNGEDDGNRFLEEILMSLQWLIFIAATASFLAFQLITNAIYEEQYGGDVAWISKQSRQMFPIDEEDEDIKDKDVHNHQLRKKEFKCLLFYFFGEPKFMVSAPSKSDKPNEWECENAAEEAAGEEEEEDGETGELARESKKSLDPAQGSPP
ncbi:tumor rejection antigen P815A-like [Peromyscus leucopus]|uniref:tumor rejection antigen P815A-like n=1 Tax=Peromyscus leucopus TaxID=10041 RepID=UPI0010A1AA18|nr:tumor rejection antigen P815A-like [Peromyscus leucopus]